MSSWAYLHLKKKSEDYYESFFFNDFSNYGIELLKQIIKRSYYNTSIDGEVFISIANDTSDSGKALVFNYDHPCMLEKEREIKGEEGKKGFDVKRKVKKEYDIDHFPIHWDENCTWGHEEAQEILDTRTVVEYGRKL